PINSINFMLSVLSLYTGPKLRNGILLHHKRQQGCRHLNGISTLAVFFRRSLPPNYMLTVHKDNTPPHSNSVKFNTLALLSDGNISRHFMPGISGQPHHPQMSALKIYIQNYSENFTHIN
ncbi:MAG: hypothetical protein ACI39U_05895, partial [Candidatus Cryptobacteroides sp.]